MYIPYVHLENVRRFEYLLWDLKQHARAGWHVLLGDNGTGKSTFLKAVSLSVLGPDQFAAVDPSWTNYLRHGATHMNVKVYVERDEGLDVTVNNASKERFSCGFSFGQLMSGGYSLPRSHTEWERMRESRGRGWFSCAYGPFRRFSGGDIGIEHQLQRGNDTGRHITLFNERIILGDSLDWLRQLQFEKLEGSPGSTTVDDVVEFINQPDFLPNNVRLREISSRGVEFIDGDGSDVLIQDLSEGYRSILSMTVDLVRNLAATYPDRSIFVRQACVCVDLPGVVLIDEVDAHLHPTWQRQIGPWFRKHFPKMQFIVTTHSPLVCQAAADGGSVFKLPTPGTDETGRFLEGAELDRLLYGDILDAYSTEVFGSGITRSEESQSMLNRLATLNMKSLSARLSASETKERDRLQRIFGSSANTLGISEIAGDVR